MRELLLSLLSEDAEEKRWKASMHIHALAHTTKELPDATGRDRNQTLKIDLVAAQSHNEALSVPLQTCRPFFDIAFIPSPHALTHSLTRRTGTGQWTRIDRPLHASSAIRQHPRNGKEVLGHQSPSV